MEIERGFGRFTNGEQIEVEVIEDFLNVNGKPCLKMKNKDEEVFNCNIPPKFKNLRGRCLLTCTGIGANNFPFIELKKVQHSDWDLYDEVLEDSSEVVEELPEEEELFDVGFFSQKVELEDVLYSIQLTMQFEDKLRFTNPTINESVKQILDVLYRECGRKYAKTMGGEEVELS